MPSCCTPAPSAGERIHTVLPLRAAGSNTVQRSRRERASYFFALEPPQPSPNRTGPGGATGRRGVFPRRHTPREALARETPADTPPPPRLLSHHPPPLRHTP